MRGTVRRRALAAAIACAVVAATATGCSEDKGSKEAFCAEVADAPALAAVIGGFTEVDPTDLGDRLAEARRSYDDLRDVAPGEIDDDVDEVVDLVDAVLDAVDAHRDDPEAVADRLRTTLDDHKGAAAAAVRVAAYARTTCKVELEPTTPADTGASSTTASTADTAGTTTTTP